MGKRGRRHSSRHSLTINLTVLTSDQRHKETKEKKKKEKVEQHLVPRTYLKHWRIAKDKNFVYGIDFTNEYKKGVQIFGLNDKVFKQKRYYNDNSLQNPFAIEDILGQNIEPNYEIIMSEVNSEQKLSQPVREKIMLWLYISKMRSPYMRDNTERLANFFYKTAARYKNKNLSTDLEKAIGLYSKHTAKKTQLRTLIDREQVRELLALFLDTLNSKHWRILKSIPQFQFWTNDNPGFSLNTSERFAKEVPYHRVMEMNPRSIILYPLSPKYCLEISPFQKGTPENVSALTMDIKFEQASPQLIEYINKGVLYTRSKLIVSNNKEILEYCIKRK
jgi:hypothetical protein